MIMRFLSAGAICTFVCIMIYFYGAWRMLETIRSGTLDLKKHRLPKSYWNFLVWRW